MIYPKECGICNSGKISACDECEQTLSFSYDRCNGMFEVEKPFHDRSLWWNSKRICNLCGLNKATIDDGVNDICNECNFNQQQKAERIPMKILTNDQIISARRIALLLWQLKIISSREFGKICTRAERRRWEGVGDGRN